jgi:hypothetical protein
VAVDLYFPKTKQKVVERVIVHAQKSGKNCLKSKSCQKLLASI